MDSLQKLNATFSRFEREKTFAVWPFQGEENVCTAEKMAAAGFFFVGNEREPDLVECFICSKQLDGWEPNDDPWAEHVKHQPDCQFVKLNKCDETTWTVKEMFDLFKIYNVKQCTRELDKAMSKAREENRRLADKIPKLYKEIRKGPSKRS